MGTRLPPNTPGDPCGQCWGSGLPFGDGATPRFISASITGFTFPDYHSGNAAFLSQPHQLIQSPTAPCYFHELYQLYTLTLIFHDLGSFMQLIRFPSQQLWRAETTHRCVTSIPGLVFPLTANPLQGGQASLSWSLEGL